MWYFSWVLGVSFAISFSIINALWLEEKVLAAGEAHTATGDGEYTLIPRASNFFRRGGSRVHQGDLALPFVVFPTFARIE